MTRGTRRPSYYGTPLAAIEYSNLELEPSCIRVMRCGGVRGLARPGECLQLRCDFAPKCLQWTTDVCPLPLPCPRTPHFQSFCGQNVHKISTKTTQVIDIAMT